jgi:hypothetical protein
MRKLPIAVLVALLASTGSRAEDNKACISKAIGSLPRVSGLVVKKTRTGPVPKEILATWQGQTRPIIVAVDVVVWNELQTYSYICALSKGTAYVRRVLT